LQGQVSEQSRVIAAQAALRANDLSRVAAESTSGARAQLAGMHLPEALANLTLPAGDGDQQQPAAEQLEKHAITPEFCTFVRGLTYPTFRYAVRWIKYSNLTTYAVMLLAVAVRAGSREEALVQLLLLGHACRDFPQEELDRLVAFQQESNGCADGANASSEGSAPLNPWQVGAMCALQELVTSRMLALNTVCR
jgi:hypothetical protein